MRLQIIRDGQFAVHKPATDGQCGPKGTHVFTYEVVIEGNDKHLNPQGFIIDNLAIHNYFVKKYVPDSNAPFVSCEKMAATAVRDFRKLLSTEPGVKVYAISVSISGMQGVSSSPTKKLILMDRLRTQLAGFELYYLCADII